MGSRKMGRHRSAEEEREVSTLRKKQGGEKSLSKMRTTCKSHTMTSSQKASAVKRKRAAQNTGPKPTNVKTIIKRTKKSDGGYIGSFIDLNVDGKTYSNPSYRKYYKGML
jgi:hypothetical protein